MEIPLRNFSLFSGKFHFRSKFKNVSNHNPVPAGTPYAQKNKDSRMANTFSPKQGQVFVVLLFLKVFNDVKNDLEAKKGVTRYMKTSKKL